MTRIKVLLLFIFLMVSVAVNAAKTDFNVTYVSVDHVYIDGGTADDLAVGVRFKLAQQKDQTAVLEIVFISKHSASCTIIDGSQDFVVGAAVSKMNAVGGEKKDAKPKPVEANQVPGSPGFRAPVRVSGNSAIVFNHWFDNSAANLDFTQSSARLNLIASNLLRENVTFALRTRSRYDIRTRAYGNGVGKTSWENRLWELSLTYYDPNSALSFAVGRILPRRLGSIGYLDGAMIDLRASSGVALGVFGGQQPSLLFSNVDHSITKAGIYSEFKSNMQAATQISQAFGLVQEMHGKITSRSFVASSGRVRFGRRWGLSHTIEMDINTGWREAKASSTLSLSNLYLHTDYQWNPKVRTSLNYDKRESYWTYLYKNLADSLFDQRVNQGLRALLDLSPLKNIWLSGSFGYRKPRQEANPTTNYTGTARVSQVLNTGISVSTFYSGFNSPFEHGTNYRIGLDFDLRSFGAVSTGFSNYDYTIEQAQPGQSPTRSSRSLELGLFKDFASNYYFGSTFRSDSGDDVNGVRLQFELGYRY